MSSLDNLKKAARRWLKALRTDDPDARARLERTMPAAPADPVLRDMQHALAREHGHENWLDLKVDDPATPLERADVTIPQEREHPASGMLHPVELRLTLPMELRGGLYSTTTDVWHMLVASRTGDLERVRALVAATPGLSRCEYNYMPPLHLAVREGHLDVVEFLLAQGAYDPAYTAYPYKGETLVRMAEDRNHTAIAAVLLERAGQPGQMRSRGNGVHGVGHIEFPRDDERSRLEKLIGANAVHAVEALLDRRPGLAHDELVFYAEGVLAQAANRSMRQLLDLLLARGARVPDISKWGRFYYFKHVEIAAMLLERGMNPNHMTWHRTTLLHDMAGEGNEEKTVLLLKHGAELNRVDDEFRSTPLGFAARWGRRNSVRLLLDHGADPNVAGADWATPLAWAEKKGHPEIARDLRAAGAR